jgi:hypothetical protein
MPKTARPSHRALKPRALGARTWTIPDAYLPAIGKKGPTGYVGHESLCVLNCSGKTAVVRIGFYFADRAPVNDIVVSVPAERCLHIRFDDPAQLGGFVVPREVPYGLRVESTVPIVVQHSRLDVTQPNMAFLSAIAHPQA